MLNAMKYYNDVFAINVRSIYQWQEVMEFRIFVGEN